MHVSQLVSASRRREINSVERETMFKERREKTLLAGNVGDGAAVMAGLESGEMCLVRCRLYSTKTWDECSCTSLVAWVTGYVHECGELEVQDRRHDSVVFFAC